MDFAFDAPVWYLLLLIAGLATGVFIAWIRNQWKDDGPREV